MRELQAVVRMDLLKLRSVGGAILPLLLVALFLSAVMNANAVIFLFVVIIYFFVYTPAAYDEQSKGDYLTGALPVRRERIVAAKYLYDLAVVAGACLVALAANGVGAALRPGEGGRAAGVLPVLILIGCAFTAVVQPLILGLGVTKARYAILVVYALGVAAATALGVNTAQTRMQAMSLLPGWMPSSMILLGALLLAVSYPIARRLYARREFTD